MKNIAWERPIRIEDPETGLFRTVRTVRQAQNMLVGHWPATRGSRFVRAEKTFDEALLGKASSNAARQAFIDAAVEAHLHLS